MAGRGDSRPVRVNYLLIITACSQMRVNAIDVIGKNLGAEDSGWFWNLLCLPVVEILRKLTQIIITENQGVKALYSLRYSVHDLWTTIVYCAAVWWWGVFALVIYTAHLPICHLPCSHDPLPTADKYSYQPGTSIFRDYLTVPFSAKSVEYKYKDDYISITFFRTDPVLGTRFKTKFISLAQVVSS